MTSLTPLSKWQSLSPWFLRRTPEPMHFWLRDRASLTSRLLAVCGPGFNVRLLHQADEIPLADELRLLGIEQREKAFVRHVQLRCAEQPLVFARTIIPHSQLRGRLLSLTRLGNRPLGAVLFATPGVQRLEVEIARVTARHPLHSHCQGDSKAVYWGRRSVFDFQGHRLLVNEIFLKNPDATNT